MIKHKIENRIEPTKHIVNYPIAKKEVYRIRCMLELEHFEKYSDEKLEKLGIIFDSEENVISVAFDDGATLDWRLCCGTNNYYDEILFQHPTGEWEDLDCTYELDDIEIDTGSDIYIVNLELTDE